VQESVKVRVLRGFLKGKQLGTCWDTRRYFQQNGQHSLARCGNDAQKSIGKCEGCVNVFVTLKVTADCGSESGSRRAMAAGNLRAWKT
jgi:hypothetical protein